MSGWVASGSWTSNGSTSTASPTRTSDSAWWPWRAPTTPSPPWSLRDGRVAEMDGRSAEDFDALDALIAAHGIDLSVAEEAMALDDVAFARLFVDFAVPRAEVVRLVVGDDAGQARPGRRAAPPGRADHGDDQAAGAAHAEQPGPRDQPARRPAAARRRRGDRGGVRLPRGRDHGPRARRRPVQRGGGDGGRGDRLAGRARAVLGRGGHGARDGHPRPGVVRRDRQPLRHRVGLRRRRRHAVQQGGPGRGVRQPGRQDAGVVRGGRRGADGRRRAVLDAVPRVPLRLAGPRDGRPGRAERRHRRRQRGRPPCPAASAS